MIADRWSVNVMRIDRANTSLQYTQTVAGFSILEAMLTLALVAVLAVYSVGGFQQLLKQSVGRRAISALADSIQLARSAAAQHNSLVTLCRSQDGQTCGGQWENGSIVFIDGNGNRVLDAEDELLVWNNFEGLAGSLRWRAFQNRQFLQITPQGFTRFQNGNFLYCPPDNDVRGAVQLIVSRTARTRYAADNDGDGVVENSQGNAVLCRE
ncbi:MAG: GspH/FimT family pseudopilin [Pseudohongiellaceae bacterium]